MHSGTWLLRGTGGLQSTWSLGDSGTLWSYVGLDCVGRLKFLWPWGCSDVLWYWGPRRCLETLEIFKMLESFDINWVFKVLEISEVLTYSLLGSRSILRCLDMLWSLKQCSLWMCLYHWKCLGPPVCSSLGQRCLESLKYLGEMEHLVCSGFIDYHGFWGYKGSLAKCLHLASACSVAKVCQVLGPYWAFWIYDVLRPMQILRPPNPHIQWKYLNPAARHLPGECIHVVGQGSPSDWSLQSCGTLSRWLTPWRRCSTLGKNSASTCHDPTVCFWRSWVGGNYLNWNSVPLGCLASSSYLGQGRQ